MGVCVSMCSRTRVHASMSVIYIIYNKEVGPGFCDVLIIM